jgi:hypothetical protein
MLKGMDGQAGPWLWSTNVWGQSRVSKSKWLSAIAHPVGVRCTVVIEELVMTTSFGAHLVHAFLNNGGGVDVEAVVGNGGLEEYVGALTSGTLDWLHGRQRAVLKVRLTRFKKRRG